VKLKDPAQAKRIEYKLDTGPFPLEGERSVDVG